MRISSTAPRRILIIDDNRAIHADFAKILGKRASRTAETSLELELFAEVISKPSHAEFELSSAYQGQEALQMAIAAREEGRPYSVAFVDMRMPPGWDGVETITRLWEVDPELQCVICSAYSDYSWEDILDKLGLSDQLLVLKKPFDAAEVCQLACALTEKWHLARHAHLKLAQLRGMVEEQTRDLEQANRRLQDSETRYALAMAGANDGLWDWNIAQGAVFYSQRWKSMLGYAEDEIAAFPSEWLDRLHPDDRRRVEREISEQHSGVVAQLSTEYRIMHKDGQYRWMLCRGAVSRRSDGEASRAAGSQTDITDRKMAEAQLRHVAFHDALTGLPNRVLLSERIERCLVRHRREPAFGFAVMFLDMDRFKVINDSLGHLVGDGLLIALAERLSHCIRETDTLAGPSGNLARIGGDEFVLLLEGIKQDADVFRVADRLLASVSEPLVVGEHTLHASLSMGIAINHQGYERVDDLLRDADTALYRAKADGRGRYRVFSDDLHAAAMARWQIENDLRSAIEHRQFFLQYQPILTLSTGAVEHVEALVRWRHPTKGLISPAEFVPLAEETGLIVPLGRWILEESCRQVQRWNEELDGKGAISVAVNVSSKQFALPAFVDDVRAILALTRTSASMVRIEVTEGVLMDANAVDACKRLAAMGIRLHLDDFGTGYSSLSYLHRMPIHALKIDRSFVSRMVAEPMDASIVQTILSLARALGIQVIAEGVETASEVQMSCESGQGYYWARPLDAEYVLDFVRTARQVAEIPEKSPDQISPQR